MRVILADQRVAFRTALRLFLQEQENIEAIYEVGRVGELLRDAPGFLPDIIFLSWELPDFKTPRTPHNPEDRIINQTKAVVIAALHRLPSNPLVVVIGSKPEERLTVLHTGADDFLYQGESEHIRLLLKTLHNKHTHS